MKSKNKLVPRLLGITKESVMRVDEKTKDVVQEWPLTTVKRWAASPKSFTLVRQTHALDMHGRDLTRKPAPADWRLIVFLFLFFYFGTAGLVISLVFIQLTLSTISAVGNECDWLTLIPTLPAAAAWPACLFIASCTSVIEWTLLSSLSMSYVPPLCQHLVNKQHRFNLADLVDSLSQGKLTRPPFLTVNLAECCQGFVI